MDPNGCSSPRPSSARPEASSPSRARPCSVAVARLIVAALLLPACVSTNPHTGRTEIDAGSTALAVGALAALGGVAYLASKANDKDDHGREDWGRYDRPHRNVRCDAFRRVCYDRHGVSRRWTAREFGRNRR